jgi:integrase
MKTSLRIVAPTIANRTVTPRRRPNAAYRTREHLTAAEIEKLIKAAGTNRWGHRDATMILVAYRHGLRASELVDLRWDQIDFSGGIRWYPGQANKTHHFLSWESFARKLFTSS